MLVIEFVLVAAIFILGTTIVWSQLHPTLKGLNCEKCTCNCPPGVPGPKGQDGKDCELISENGMLGCRYVDGSTKMSNIAISEAAGIGIVEKATSYSAQLWLVFGSIALIAAVIFFLNPLQQKSRELLEIQNALKPRMQQMTAHLAALGVKGLPREKMQRSA